MVAFREASSDNLRYLDHYPPPFLAASTNSAILLFCSSFRAVTDLPILCIKIRELMLCSQDRIVNLYLNGGVFTLRLISNCVFTYSSCRSVYTFPPPDYKKSPTSRSYGMQVGTFGLRNGILREFNAKIIN
jgi:hypothetical protein